MRVAILANFPLHVIPSLANEFPPTGHYSSWFPPLAEIWARNDGIERLWITFSDTITERKQAVYWNQTFIVIPKDKGGRASSFFRKDRLAIKDCLKELNPDLVHGWGTEDVYALGALESGLPSIISMQGILSYYVLRSWINLRTLFQAAMEIFILRKAKAITCESEWAKPIIQRRAPRAKITCVEYGIHPAFFEAKWKPNAAQPVALFVGTVETRKGIQDLLEAFRSPKLAQSTLWVVGTGPLVNRNLGDRIKWLGRLDPIGLIEVMSKAWCLVLPTRADTSPNVVKEARVIGLPVITTEYGGQSDYIKDGKNGYIVQPGNIARLTDCLHILLSNLDVCRERGEQNWEADRALFRVELTAAKFHKLYSEMIEQK
jgi:glycosyltransferase involved in cell wall biosynthesis